MSYPSKKPMKEVSEKCGFCNRHQTTLRLDSDFNNPYSYNSVTICASCLKRALKKLGEE